MRNSFLALLAIAIGSLHVHGKMHTIWFQKMCVEYDDATSEISIMSISHDNISMPTNLPVEGMEVDGLSLSPRTFANMVGLQAPFIAHHRWIDNVDKLLQVLHDSDDIVEKYLIMQGAFSNPNVVVDFDAYMKLLDFFPQNGFGARFIVKNAMLAEASLSDIIYGSFDLLLTDASRVRFVKELVKEPRNIPWQHLMQLYNLLSDDDCRIEMLHSFPSDLLKDSYSDLLNKILDSNKQVAAIDAFTRSNLSSKDAYQIVAHLGIRANRLEAIRKLTRHFTDPIIAFSAIKYVNDADKVSAIRHLSAVLQEAPPENRSNLLSSMPTSIRKQVEEILWPKPAVAPAPKTLTVAQPVVVLKPVASAQQMLNIKGMLRGMSADGGRNSILADALSNTLLDCAQVATILGFYDADAGRNAALPILLKNVQGTIHASEVVNIFKKYSADSGRNTALPILQGSLDASIAFSDMIAILKKYDADAGRNIGLPLLMIKINAALTGEQLKAILRSYSADSGRNTALKLLVSIPEVKNVAKVQLMTIWSAYDADSGKKIAMSIINY